MQEDASVLLLTGTVATGKTTIAAEIATLLAERGERIVTADLDELGRGFSPRSAAPRSRRRTSIGASLTILPEIERTLDETGLEDYSVENDGGSPRDVASAVLRLSGWL